MRKRLIRALAAVAACALLAGAAALALPGGRASAVPPPPDSDWCGSPGETVHWTQISSGNDRSTWEGFIYRSHTRVICLELVFGNGGSVPMGFAALTTTSRTGHHLEICDYNGDFFYERVNVADAAGNATARVIAYRDAFGGGCFLRDLGYPIRKFRAVGAYGVPSDWLAPPPAP